MKIIFAGIMLILLTGHVVAQPTYTVKLESNVFSNTHPYSCDCHSDDTITLFFSNRTTQKITHPFGALSCGFPYNFTDFVTYDNNIHLDSLQVFGRDGHYEGDLNGCEFSFAARASVVFPAGSDCFNATYTNYIVTEHILGTIFARVNDFIIPGFNSRLQASIYPTSLVVNTPADNLLPSDDKLTLTATPGFAPSYYVWQYSADGSLWNDFPLPMQHNSTVSFSGRDLFGSDFFSRVPASTFIRINYGCGQIPSPMVTLRNSLSSPHITGVAASPTTCAGGADGSIRIQFDRVLASGESLNLLVNNLTTGLPDNQRDITIAPDSSFTFPATMKAGSYQIGMQGGYPNPTVPTYTDASGQSTTVNLLAPPALVFSATNSHDVYCFGGSDGVIGISATGGNGAYQLGSLSPGESDFVWTPFTSAQQTSLNGLLPGNYQIRVTDSRGCIQLVSGSESIQNVNIGQPAAPVALDFSELTNPLAFGRTDGQITAVIKGGTPIPANTYSVTWTDPAGANVSTMTNTPLTSGYQTILNNGGNGKYTLQATDAHYNLAAAGQQDGCILRQGFTLVEPPPLLISISQTKIVTCHGAATAQLTAAGNGGVEIPGTRYHYQWYTVNNGAMVPTGPDDSVLSQLPAGDYQVMITDKNGITKTSSVATIGQPDILSVAITTSALACNADTTGVATATVTGGTSPYKYNWSTEDTTAVIGGLTEGGYFLFVTDVNACQTQEVAVVSAPNGLVIDSLVSMPTCNAGCDGSIQLLVTGGAGGYSYSWNTGADVAGIAGLCAGDYSVHITDRNGCAANRKYFLQDPAPLKVNAGGDRTLCNGQTNTSDVSMADPAAQYHWTGPDGFAATTPQVSLSASGSYHVSVTDKHGCTGEDSFFIQKIDKELNADFVISTQVFKGQQVTLVNLTAPDPDSISWLLPDNPAISRISMDAQSAILVFKDTGSYTLGIKAWLAPCWATANQQIEVLEPQSFDSPGSTADPLVQSFTVAPNPTTGSFTVKVVLSNAVNIRLRLFSLLSSTIVDDRQLTGLSTYTIPYNIGNQAKGSYFLLLETPKGSSIQKIMIL